MTEQEKRRELSRQIDELRDKELKLDIELKFVRYRMDALRTQRNALDAERALRIREAEDALSDRKITLRGVEYIVKDVVANNWAPNRQTSFTIWLRRTGAARLSKLVIKYPNPHLVTLHDYESDGKPYAAMFLNNPDHRSGVLRALELVRDTNPDLIDDYINRHFRGA